MLRLLVLCISFSAGAQSSAPDLQYVEEDGLTFEYAHADSTLVTNFEADNQIYRPGRGFVYEYDYISPTGDTLLLGNAGHTPVRKDTALDNPSTITRVAFRVDTAMGTQLRKMIPNYRQTGVSYDYYNAEGVSLPPMEGSGLIENARQVWVHPFRRQTYFAMLNMNAYPYVRFPLEVGKQWTWELGIGGEAYLNPLWTDWTENTLRYHAYTVTGKTTVDFRGHPIEVWQIEALTTGEAGAARAAFLFHEQYGFVKMHFYTVKGAQWIFALREVTDTGN